MRHIEATDKAIDTLENELRPKGVPGGEAGVGYGLTEEDIAVVEASGYDRMKRGAIRLFAFIRRAA